MSTLPGTIVGDIEWFEQRVTGWAENPAAIGLTAGQVTEITTETTEARTAYDNAQAAKTAAKNATMTQNTQVSEMRSFGNQVIKTIRAYALTQPDPNAVYTAASVPPPKDPQSNPPEQPYGITYDLNDSGALELKWKGNTQGGSTVYSVLRSVQTEPGEPFGQLEQVGLTGVRSFTDSTVPACTIAAQYIIKAYKGSFSPVGSVPIVARFTAGTDFGSQSFRYVA
ncbi:MAG: hypothetical protein H6815_09440 [Phycisphaeraceae bacterium]|nr:hypothetical protein [Phycisphaerales bacterium]MCB9860661.1 hypothetical protein [Phycisphaeraceae bacterium]